MQIVYLFPYRLGYMFWSDGTHKQIAAARGTSAVILVNSDINYPGIWGVCAMV